MALIIAISHLLPIHSIKPGRFIQAMIAPIIMDITIFQPGRRAAEVNHQTPRLVTAVDVRVAGVLPSFWKRAKTKIEVTGEQVVTYGLEGSAID